MSATKNAVTGAVPKQGPVITDWRPEDSHFWAAGGKAIATRNLWISIPALAAGVRGVDGVEHGDRPSQQHRLHLHY